MSFNNRYSKVTLSDGRNRLYDNINGTIFSQERLTKKAIKRTLKNPSGRQLRKEKKFLREQAKLNAESKF